VVRSVGRALKVKGDQQPWGYPGLRERDVATCAAELRPERDLIGRRVAGWGGSEDTCRLELSLSLIFITRVAPHCVNTLMILHAAHTLMMSAG